MRFPDLPAKMRSLPVDGRGFPVPWFVAWVDGEPRFPVADGRRDDPPRRTSAKFIVMPTRV